MFQNSKTFVVIEVLLILTLLVYRHAVRKSDRPVVNDTVMWLVLLTPVIGLYGKNPYVLFGYLTLAVGFSSRNLAECAATYVLLLPMTPILSLQTAIGGVYLFPFSTILAMNFGALLAFLRGSGRPPRHKYNYDWYIAAIVFIFIYIDGRDTTVTSVVRTTITCVSLYAGPYLLVSRGIRTRPDVNLLLMRFVLGAFITSIVAFFQAQQHWLIYQIFYETLKVRIPLQSWTMMLRGGMLRTGGPMLDFSACGVYLSTVISVLPIVWSRFKPGWNWMCLGVLLLGLYVTQSRGGYLATAVGVCFVMAWLRRTALVALAAILGGFAFGLLSVFGSEDKVASKLTGGEAAQGTIEYRNRLLTRGMDQISAHPIFGQRPGDLTNNMRDMMQGQHIVDFVNSHLFVAMTAGLPLFAVWCYVWLAPIARSWSLRSRRAPDAMMAAVPAAIIVPTMVAIAATSLIDRNIIWPIIALGLAPACFTLASAKRKPLVEQVPMDNDDADREPASEVPPTWPPATPIATPTTTVL